MRYVAKEATDNGQIIDHSNLTDSGIFERLERETKIESKPSSAMAVFDSRCGLSAVLSGTVLSVLFSGRRNSLPESAL
jgi:hypothetical protein